MGTFSDESLELYTTMVSESTPANYSEKGEVYDFTRCVRPDGSSYGTSGKCRKGTEGEKDSKDHKKPGKAKKYPESKFSYEFDMGQKVLENYKKGGSNEAEMTPEIKNAAKHYGIKPEYLLSNINKMAANAIMGEGREFW